MKKILLILTGSIFVISAYAQGNGNGNGNGSIPTEHNEATIAQLQAEMASGKLSSVKLTKEYIARIQALNQSGPNVNAVIELNPDALAMAKHADDLRKHGQVLGPLHGIRFCSRITSVPAIKCKPAPDLSRLSAHPRKRIQLSLLICAPVAPSFSAKLICLSGRTFVLSSRLAAGRAAAVRRTIRTG